MAVRFECFRPSALVLSVLLISLAPNPVHAAGKKKNAAAQSDAVNDSAPPATDDAARATRIPAAAEPQVLYVSMKGDDAAAVRGGSQHFATVAAAISKTRAGDTVHLMPGRFPVSGAVTCAKSINLTGEGTAATTIVPDDSTAFRFKAAVQVRGIHFDAGANATHGRNRSLLDLSFTNGSVVADCSFHGINAVCIMGNATTDTSFVNLGFDHVYLPVFVDSSPGLYPARLAFRNCHANHVIAGGFIIHSLHSYDNNGTGTTLLGLASGLDFINCSVKDSPNALGFEVWHGWTDIHFTRCAVEDCHFGFSISECDHATLTSCTANNCAFLFENAGSHDVSFIGCVADARPTATSPYVGKGLPLGTPVVVANGPSYAVKWVGGAIKGAVFHAFTGRDISLLGATLSSSTARIQNADDVTIQGCTFNQLAGFLPANNWVVVDCGEKNLSNIVFDGNECMGALPFACMEVYGAPNTISRLQITGNHTDGVYNHTGGFVHNQGVNLVDRLFSGNTTDNPNPVYPGNTCFPNDPY